MQSSFDIPVVQPTTVRKRDGRTTQPFDVGKIESAVRKAWLEVEGAADAEEVHRVVSFVAATLPADVADVEQIQDLVEVALMRAKKFAVAKAYIIYRQMRSEARRERLRPNSLAVSDYIHASKYARYLPDEQRREVYDETVARVEAMHLRRFAHLPEARLAEIRRAFDLVRDKRVLPSMRSMQFGGPAVEAVHCRQYNCSATLVDRPRAFAEAMYLLLCGCGVGYSVQYEHVEKLPPIADVDSKKVVHHVIEDTIEGWANALDALVSGFIGGYHVEFAYHLIRRAGSPLKTSGGRAPGHLKLKLALERVREVLAGAQGRQLRPIEAHRVMCHAADAVLSGGIRRCLPAGTLVHLTRGLVPIEAVRAGDAARTAAGWSRVTDVIEQGTQQLVEVTTQMGPFRCTANHRVAVLTSTAAYEWKTAGSLKPGDRMVFVDHVVEGHTTSLPPWSYERSPHDHTSVDIHVPDLDEEIAWFLGYLHGNGYVHVNRTSTEGGSNCVSFSMNEQDEETPERVRRLRAVLARMGVSCSDVKLEGEETRRVSAAGKQLALYCENFKQPKVPLHVPACVLEGLPVIRGAYLAGLLDSDGGADNRPLLLLSSVYPDFVRQVRAVYASLGIVTRMKLNRPEQGTWQALWHLTLVGELPRRAFDARVAPHAVKRAPARTGTQFDYGYPREFILGEDVNYNTKWSPVSAQMTAGTAERCGVDRRGLMPIAVIEVKQGVGTSATFDLTIERDHEFVAEGLLVHNSAMICLFSLEDSELMNVKADRSWFNKEPWLANANNSVVLKRDEAKEKQFKRIFGMTRHYGEPGVLFVNDYDHVTNPCQPGWATVLTPDGIRTFDDVGVGSTIWSGVRWTKITHKVLTGVKPVFGYHTQAGVFFGTENHRVMVHGKRVEVREARSIDRALYPNQDGRSTHEIECRTTMGDHSVYDITVEAEEHTYWTGGLLVSNCGEINLQPVLEHANETRSTGWAMCNLTEINAARLTSFEDFREAAWAATVIGTLQATYTDMPYLGKVTEAIVRRDALLGVGMTGMQDAPHVACNPAF